MHWINESPNTFHKTVMGTINMKEKLSLKRVQERTRKAETLFPMQYAHKKADTMPLELILGPYTSRIIL